MNTGKKIALLFLLTAIPALLLPAQTNTNTTPSIFESPTVPQWVKDLRRWEIVAFGSIPFTMLTATFAMDMYRWQNANGMDWSSEGRKYAPWPLKSAGAAGLKSKEQETIFIIAGSLSIGIAVIDQVIVQIKRYKARKKAEELPVGKTATDRQPWREETPEAQDSIEADEEAEAVPIAPEPAPEQP